MKRVSVTLLLTLLALGGQVAGAQAEPRRATAPPVDIEVTKVVPVHDGVPARLCEGPDNAIRVTLSQRGAPAPRPVSLRLLLVLPGGPKQGALFAEGSTNFSAANSVTTFTFPHVEIASRLRDRGARLVVRANSEGTIDEADLTNNERELKLDDATDWSCHR
jgi:hypothetical protein